MKRSSSPSRNSITRSKTPEGLVALEVMTFKDVVVRQRLEIVLGLKRSSETSPSRRVVEDLHGDDVSGLLVDALVDAPHADVRDDAGSS